METEQSKALYKSRQIITDMCAAFISEHIVDIEHLQHLAVVLDERIKEIAKDVS